MIVLSETTAAFCSVQKTGSTTTINRDKSLPEFPLCTMARFSPKTGNICAIVDAEGLHFVDTRTGLQTIMLANPSYVALEWSP